MANNEFTIPIPARLKNVAKGGHVAGAEDIIDDALGKEQSVINKEVREAIEGNTEAVAAERQRAVTAEGALDNRLSDVEELAEISIDGGEAKIATGEDFHNPTAEQRAKIPTVGAILDGADDEPTAGSENLVKSGGIAESISQLNQKVTGIIDDGTRYDNTNYATGTRVGVFYPIDGFSAGQKIDITLKNIVYAGTNVRVWLCTEKSRWEEALVRVISLFSSGEEHSLTVELTETDLLTARYIQILSDANDAAVSFNSFVSLQGENLKTLSNDVKELKENVRPIDSDATEDSTNLVESGAVYDLTHITSSESVGGTRIAGKEVNNNTKTFWDNASCENYGFAVVPGDVFLISSQVIGQGRTAMFYSQEGADPNDYISYYGEYQESMHTNNDVRIVIPEGCHYVYFNNRTDNGFAFSAKKQFAETVANKVQELSDSYPKYSYDGTTLVLKGTDAEISFKVKGVNGIFMISKIATNNKTYTPSTDFVSPFIVRVDANGVAGASRIHTGGYHGTDGGAGGNATAYTESITILADGKQITDTHGKFVSCTQIIFEVINRVSAYNTIDNGVCLRYPIEEHDVYSFDGKRLNVNIQIIANEDLHIEYYHGLQSAGYTTQGALIGFDDVISKSFTFSSDSYSDYMPNLVEVQNEFGDCLLMHVERIGIANSDKVTPDKMWGAYSYGKTGWNLIFDYEGLAMQANERTTCVGYYEFNSIKKL